MKFVLIALVSVFASASALADQCAVVSYKQAIQAVKFINTAAKVERFCASCGDSAPKTLKPYTVDVQTFGGPGSGSWGVSVNGNLEDLAYLYVDGINVARVVGCSTTGVDPTL